MSNKLLQRLKEIESLPVYKHANNVLPEPFRTEFISLLNYLITLDDLSIIFVVDHDLLYLINKLMTAIILNMYQLIKELPENIDIKPFEEFISFIASKLQNNLPQRFHTKIINKIKSFFFAESHN